MSASDPDSTIYLNDTDNQIKKKIGKAFSGGQDTREMHEKLGGRTEVDVPFQYLSFFMEDDDQLEHIRQEYEAGRMQSGAMKAAATKELQAYVAQFKTRRQAITTEIREEFMRPRQLAFKGMPPVADQEKTLRAQQQLLEQALAKVNAEISALAT